LNRVVNKVMLRDGEATHKYEPYANRFKRGPLFDSAASRVNFDMSHANVHDGHTFFLVRMCFFPPFSFHSGKGEPSTPHAWSEHTTTFNDNDADDSDKQQQQQQQQSRPQAQHYFNFDEEEQQHQSWRRVPEAAARVARTSATGETTITTAVVVALVV
jgi:hypothetical protein